MTNLIFKRVSSGKSVPWTKFDGDQILHHALEEWLRFDFLKFTAAFDNSCEDLDHPVKKSETEPRLLQMYSES